MDLIDRAEVLYKFAEILPEADSLEWYEQAKPDEVKELVDELYSIVLNVNQIDAQPVKRGKWETKGGVHCTRCGWRPTGRICDLFTAYCAGCGAKMYGDAK